MNPTAKYLYRALKSYIYFLIVLIVIVSILVLITPEYSFDMIFKNEGGIFRENSWPKILAMFGVLALIYPGITYVKKEVLIEGTFEEHRNQIIGVFENANYDCVREDDEKVYFRQRSALTRIMRLCEDEVSITKGEAPLILSGARKEIIRLASGILYATKK